MMTCVYCRITDKGFFKGREHVIPRSFGTFGPKTPTLHCVCDKCNDYFKKDLDQALARDTLEGITRYKKGLFSRQRQFPKNLVFTLEERVDTGDYGGAILGGYDPTTGKLLPPVAQFWIRNIQVNEWERYTLDQIKYIKIIDEKYGPNTPGSREMRILAPTKDDYDLVTSELKKFGIPYKEKEILGLPPFLKNTDSKGKVEIQGRIHGVIDKNKKRAFVKIIFNFATYYLGEEEVSKPQWDKVRDFVRNNGEILSGRITQEPFWNGQETDKMCFTDNSYNIRIENKNANVLGTIQFYNLLTYEFILIENYSLTLEQEVAYRFTPGEEPYVGIKMSKPE
ncbi:MAG: hypothetical protein A3C84_02395 [Candidatus Ryanbacteria bacterium RIFCSPHIGHO2_02_FULL_48_12]|uniref:HNH endonuclease 5 domain-containing protein n=1 Tax=Candidatus Ryanbacteria bacterium RIFCSPHIGHO2_01_FULL_48_27 TaxID=1802115 RepID=A0A1G2G706_9BACT|nr:MAG: hypothetical protein A2756_01995 [Candidatus Ryanbacteria bacterium RIFCSPHIGHO2_01_FULL_48_27]OGZ50158.1 MAG: hypothetical protein A3C84_02395 [Candidatus Ryanbacteria bacterium RIFCSPHIGHO2_02_FULL_48_12]